MLPLTIKQTRSMKSMQKLQPELKKVQKKHKDDKKKQQEELLKLYSKHKVNPLGGCLPIVLQFPVFIALFTILRKKSSAKLKEEAVTVPAVAAVGKAVLKASFLGIGLGASMQSVVAAGASFATLVPGIILMGAMIVSHYFHSKAMGTGDKSQSMMMNMMLIMMAYFAYIFPAGLVIYWTTTNLVGIFEHYIINRFFPHHEPEKQGA